MRDYEWKSNLSGLMRSFIEMNHLAGLKFEQQERFLQHFDHFCFYNGYEGESLTREMAEYFIYEQGGADRTLHDKEVLLYRFAEFMKQRGYHAYLPEVRTKYPPGQHIPHIYTEDERRGFLEAVDSCPHTPNSFRNTVDPVLFRFLCGTGCRLSEALNLKIADFDYCLGAVTILHARSILISTASMQAAVAVLIFFQEQSGEKWTRALPTHISGTAGIPHPKGGPRIHDWRHTLAVENLRRWSGDRLKISDFDSDLVCGFLDWLETDHGCSISTRNQRLTALHSFFRYLQKQSPPDMEAIQGINRST